MGPWIPNPDSKRTGTITPPKPPCHTGNILIGRSDTFELYGAGHSRKADLWLDHVFIDLAEIVSVEEVTVHGLKLKSFLSKVKKKEARVVKIHVTDYGVPDLTLADWASLLSALETEIKERPIKLLVLCMGGHGRTGTVLTILSHLMGFIPKKTDPIRWLRKKYCEEAVESDVQIAYIEDLLNIVTEEKPASHTSTYTYSWLDKGKDDLSVFPDEEDFSLQPGIDPYKFV